MKATVNVRAICVVNPSNNLAVCIDIMRRSNHTASRVYRHFVFIIVAQTLKFSSQCVAAAKSANKTLGMINRTFVNKDKEVMLRLYQTLVRPKLEYCVQAWRPYFRKDIDLLEKVQKRATRLIISNKGLTYGERLKNLGLTTLETRRLRGDLIEVFKIFKGLDDVKPTDFFTMSNTGLRGHEFKLYKPQAHLDIRKKNF